MLNNYTNIQTMIKHNALVTTIGFILAGLGFLSLIVALVGLRFSFLAWLDMLGPVTSFVVRLLMIVVGLSMVYVGQTNWKDDTVR